MTQCSQSNQPSRHSREAPPARKPRKPRAKAVASDGDAGAEPPADAAVAAADAAEPAVADDEPEQAAEASPASADLVPREQFARMLGYRPTELVGFERKGWLRPVCREDGTSFYNKAEAKEIRMDLRRRLQEEADQTRRNRRY